MESETDTLETITKGIWQWKSNPDPWSKTEPPQWESYSLDQNYLIEKAFYDQQKEVELRDYLVYPLDLIQRKKGNLKAQRPIRRVNWMDDEEISDRSSRYFETELPKTINKVFGSLEDFLGFFSRRNVEILEFTNHFKEFEQSQSFHLLNEKIIPILVHCFEITLLKPNEEQLQNSSISRFQKKMLLKTKERIGNLILLFQKEFSNMGEFYREVLKAYTMDTDLYPNLNKYLRNESWIEIDNLLPYVFCLFKAFFHFRLQTNFAQDDPIQEPKTSSLRTLYRGTAFDEFTLSFYDVKTIKDFSWNSVTSTSTSKKIAEEFMYKNADIPQKKYPIMFVIEISLKTETEAEYLKWIDIHQYSAIPNENEVVLAPGSVFELVEVSTDQDKKTTIKIKLRNEIQSLAHRGMMMQGALQSQMATEKGTKIMCLEGAELDQALMSLCGNKLIEEVEFCLCEFSSKLLNKMFQNLPSMPKVKRLKFIACISQGKSEVPKEKLQSSGVTTLEIIEGNDFFQMICNQRQNQEYWASLRELDLDFRSRRSLEDEELNGIVSQGLKYLFQLTCLKFNFEGCEQITDKGMNFLAKGLQSLSCLTSLALNFTESSQITDKAVYILGSQGLKWLPKLATLNLSFRSFGGNGKITNKGIHSLACQGLKYLSKLKSLHLDFGGCKLIGDKGLISLASKGFLYLGELASLTLCFFACDQITDKGVFGLKCQGLKYLPQLTSINLDLSWCTKITNGGLKSVASYLLDNSLQITCLALCFGKCKDITNSLLDTFASDVLKYLNNLTSLTLDFHSCNQITQEGIKSLMSKGFQNLIHLSSLTVDFRGCYQIEEKEVNSEVVQWLKHLKIFKSLTIEFEVLRTASSINIQIHQESEDVVDFRLIFARETSERTEEPRDLVSKNCNIQKSSNTPESFKQLEDLPNQDPFKKRRSHSSNSTFITSYISNKIHHLTSLTLVLSDFQSFIRDKVIVRASQAFKDFRKLASLTLNFSGHGCCEITDQGLRNFAQYGLSRLLRLTSLKLNFSRCFEIKDQWLSNFAIKGLLKLTSLTSLILDFSGNTEIIDGGLLNLVISGLSGLSQLLSLNLNFSDCDMIDDGIINLACDGLNHLSQLTSLNLNFSSCAQITDRGVDVLVSKGLKNVIQLKSLILNFSGCTQITDTGLIELAHSGLNHLFELTSFNLNLRWCEQITDKGVDNFVSKGLENLIQLQSLTLDISSSPKITDKAVNNLILRVIKNLSRLIFLNINCFESLNISDYTIYNLAKVLRYFGFKKAIAEEEEEDQRL